MNKMNVDIKIIITTNFYNNAQIYKTLWKTCNFWNRCQSAISMQCVVGHGSAIVHADLAVTGDARACRALTTTTMKGGGVTII